MTILNPSRYNFSFTAASLRPELARIVAECYLEAGSWEGAKDRIRASNALQSRSAVSSKRMEQEMRQRLASLTDRQLQLLAHATAEDRAAMAWLAALKHVAFAYEFAAEVLRDKLAAYDPILRPSDYETFVETKAATHPELAELAESSRSKVRQTLLRMLHEAGILGTGTSARPILRPTLSPDARQVIVADDPRWLAGFLVPDAEIGAL